MMITRENSMNVESSLTAKCLGVDCMEYRRDDTTENIVGLGAEASHGRSDEDSR